jgi:hypothetical protein
MRVAVLISLLLSLQGRLFASMPPEPTQKVIFYKLIGATNRGTDDAAKRIPVPYFYSYIESGSNTATWAKINERNMALANKLADKYWIRVERQYHISAQEADQIQYKGINSGWPMPK